MTLDEALTEIDRLKLKLRLAHLNIQHLAERLSIMGVMTMDQSRKGNIKHRPGLVKDGQLDTKEYRDI